ncbi:hypothetical protein G9C98_006396 [Cotesia typhae]|uniref:Uncharacterized protein n=1 Tax=Cotesia typhae TaxID=2053667 RepID=A0A8J5UYV0_9HYME|nr:hypothetical protein G9C98_006396 [Cotesia typhae]
MKYKLIFIISLTYISVVVCQAKSYDDKRCKCICPSISSVINTTTPSNPTNKRMNFIGNVSPSDCNCDGVVLPKIKDQLNGQELIFCPRCECKYENRNTTIIKDETIASNAAGTSHAMGVRGNVLNRVGHQQDKWKRQVREQRRNIYDRHTMLN